MVRPASPEQNAGSALSNCLVAPRPERGGRGGLRGLLKNTYHGTYTLVLVRMRVRTDKLRAICVDVISAKRRISTGLAS